MKRSGFDGRLSAYYIFELLLFFVSLATAFIFMPVVFYFFEKYRIEHSQIDGVNLKFNGKLYEAYFIFVIYLGVYSAFAALSNYILYIFGLFLSSQVTVWAVNGIILLINLFYLRTQLRNWSSVNIAFENTIAPSYIKPMFLEFLRSEILAMGVNIVTLKLASPLAHEIRMKMFAQRQILSGNNLKFLGSRKQLYKRWWACVALNIITLGFFIPVSNYNVYKWRMEGLHLKR